LCSAAFVDCDLDLAVPIVGRDLGRGRARENPDHDRGPSGGRAQPGRDLPPSNPRRTAPRRDAAPPSERPHREAESSSLHATYSVFQPDTNSRLPTRTRALALAEERGPHVVEGADQF
jgi:hypothetical protein